MKNILLMSALIATVCYSCDSRKTKKEALEHAVSQFRLNSSFERSIYQPNMHVEIVTDTIIANTVAIHINNYSVLDDAFLVSITTDNGLKTKHYQRMFESEIHVSNLDKTLLKTLISAKQFREIEGTDPFWDKATLQHTWVNQELSTAENIKLDISFINPQNKSYKLYRMSIHSDGQKTIDLIEKSS